VRFSVRPRSITGFLEVGVWNRFIGFWVNAVGFSTALLLDFYQSGILQLPQGVDRFLPPAVEQLHYFVDGIVEVNPPIFICPAVFPGQVCPAQDKGIQYLCFVGQEHECGGFKKEIGEPGKADRFFRLVDINGVCHIVFCGRLEARFLGQTVVSIACPCSALVKPCKSRTFQPLTVHTRPPFPFTFCFLSPVNSGGTAGAVFCPVGFRDEHTAADRTAFQVLIPENLCFQRSDLRQDRPAEPLTADRERSRLRAGAGVPIVKEHTVPVLIVAALPADQGVCLFPLCRCHAVKGTILLALYGRQSFIWVLSHVFPPFFLCPEKASCLVVASCVSFVSPQAAKLTRSASPPLPTKPCDFAGTPTMAACSGVGTLPGLRDILSRSGSLRCFPCRGIPFRTVIYFSRCSSSMNYPKSTPKRPPTPYIHKVGNQLGKEDISTLSELW
jgi:hypothetical protein